MSGRRKAQRGFTLIELLLVISIIGILLAAILPRALRASHEAKFSQIRQSASEIGSYMTQWAQNQTFAQRIGSEYTVKDFLVEEIDPDVAGFSSPPLVDKYTGNDAFDGVEKLIPPERLPANPFNEVSYFSRVNDDPGVVPSRKPGLVYLVSAVDPGSQMNFRYFYLLYTAVPTTAGKTGTWYGEMDHRDGDAVRRGIFVSRYPEAVKEVRYETFEER